MRKVHAVLLALAIVGIVFFLFAGGTAVQPWSPPRIAGGCLMLGVLALVVTARIQLGEAFSVTPQARRLVTTGLYSRIRNPIYVASPFLFVGLSLVLMRWWPLLLAGLVGLIQAYRAHREAAVLRASFGDEYDRYRAQTWF